MRNLPCKRIQCDEIWSFCYSKQSNVPEQFKGQFGYGDVYTWTALCADTNLVPSFVVGQRDAWHAMDFIEDLAGRFNHRVQITTDGHKAYLEAIEGSFGIDVDYAMLVKLYGKPVGKEEDRKYSPPVCTGAEKKVITGNPDMKYVSTSYVERQNLTMRMGMRRFTRLTNGFSKKIDNLFYAVALHFMHYNFARVHKTLRVHQPWKRGVRIIFGHLKKSPCLQTEVFFSCGRKIIHVRYMHGFKTRKTH